MNLTHVCTKCRHVNRTELAPPPDRITCAGCRQEMTLPAGALDGERLERCLVCPSTDLYVRKDFPQRLGVGIVTLGILASCVAWAYTETLWTFAILFATALIDVVLYAVVGDVLMCYRCGAYYRGLEGLERHAPFDLETHERHRQQKARLAEHQRA